RLLAREDPRGTEDDDRVADAQLLEARLGLQVLREDAQAPRLLAVEEGLVLVRLDRPEAPFLHESPLGWVEGARSLASRPGARQGRAVPGPHSEIRSTSPRATSSPPSRV